MEGGSVDFNGKGTLLTSKCCLLNPNRNPQLDRDKIEEYLRDYYGVEQILWVSEGIVGDDTDGHIDDTVRFVNEDTVITVVEENRNDENYELLQKHSGEKRASTTWDKVFLIALFAGLATVIGLMIVGLYTVLHMIFSHPL